MEDLQNLEVFEIFAIDNLSNNDWRKTIVEVFETPTETKNWNIKYKALSYVIIDNKLFKKTPKWALLKCLSESEAYLEILNVQYGSCGAPQAGYKMKWLLFQQGVYLPTMLKI